MRFIIFTEFGSEKFDQFLHLLGDKIRLRGWDKYRGGLDVKGKVFVYVMLCINNSINNSTHQIRIVFTCNSIECLCYIDYLKVSCIFVN